MKQRFKVELIALNIRNDKSGQSIRTTDKILLVDKKGIYKPAEFKDVDFADKCSELLNQVWA